MPTTPTIVISSVKLQFKFLTAKTPPNPLPNFVANPINTPLLTTSMMGATTISTHVVVILASSNRVTPTPTCCFRVSTITISNTIGGAMLTQDQ